MKQRNSTLAELRIRWVGADALLDTPVMVEKPHPVRADLVQCNGAEGTKVAMHNPKKIGRTLTIWISDVLHRLGWQRKEHAAATLS